MAPILAPELHRAWNAKAAGAADGASQEGDELVFGHLADRHRELAMRQAGALADEAGDLHVVGRVGEGNLSEFFAHERCIARHLQGVGAENAVRSNAPEIAGAGYSGARAVDRLNLVLRLRRFRLFDDEIDHRHFEASHRHIKVDNDVHQMLQLDREDVVVPACQRGELVVRQDVGAYLIVAEMLDAESRNLRHAQPLGRGEPSVASDNHAILVDQDRVDEAERLEAVADQFDLALGVSASVAGVGLEAFESDGLDARDGDLRRNNHDDLRSMKDRRGFFGGDQTRRSDRSNERT